MKLETYLAQEGKKKNLMQKDVAEGTGLNRLTLGNYLAGSRQPSLLAAYKLHLFTDGAISPFDLLDEETKKEVQAEIKQRKKLVELNLKTRNKNK